MLMCRLAEADGIVWELADWIEITEIWGKREMVASKGKQKGREFLCNWTMRIAWRWPISEVFVGQKGWSWSPWACLQFLVIQCDHWLIEKNEMLLIDSHLTGVELSELPRTSLLCKGLLWHVWPRLSFWIGWRVKCALCLPVDGSNGGRAALVLRPIRFRVGCRSSEQHQQRANRHLVQGNPERANNWCVAGPKPICAVKGTFEKGTSRCDRKHQPTVSQLLVLVKAWSMAKEQPIYGVNAPGSKVNSGIPVEGEYGRVSSPSYNYHPADGVYGNKRIDHQPLVNYEIGSDVSWFFYLWNFDLILSKMIGTPKVPLRFRFFFGGFFLEILSVKFLFFKLWRHPTFRDAAAFLPFRTFSFYQRLGQTLWGNFEATLRQIAAIAWPINARFSLSFIWFW